MVLLLNFGAHSFPKKENLMSVFLYQVTLQISGGAASSHMIIELGQGQYKRYLRNSEASRGFGQSPDNGLKMTSDVDGCRLVMTVKSLLECPLFYTRLLNLPNAVTL